MDKKALIKYLCALLLFGLNGIVASHIAMSSYEIVFLRTLIGSVLLIAIFLIGKGKFHIKSNKRDALFILLSGIAMGGSWMFLYDAYQQIDETSRIEWYELVLPEPAEGFGAATLEDCLQLGRGAMVQNTGRFAFGKSMRVVQHLSRLPARGEAVAFPDWENAARAAEVRCALLRAAALLLFLFPAALAVVLLVRLYLFARTRLHGKGSAVLDFVRDRAEEYRARRKRGLPGRKG